MTHVIQVRDLMEECQRHDPSAEVVCRTSGGSDMIIGRIKYHCDGNPMRRRVAIEIADDDYTSIKEQLDEKTIDEENAVDLLVRFQALRKGGSDLSGERFEKLAKDIDDHLDARDGIPA